MEEAERAYQEKSEQVQREKLASIATLGLEPDDLLSYFITLVHPPEPAADTAAEPEIVAGCTRVATFILLSAPYCTEPNGKALVTATIKVPLDKCSVFSLVEQCCEAYIDTSTLRAGDGDVMAHMWCIKQGSGPRSRSRCQCTRARCRGLK